MLSVTPLSDRSSVTVSFFACFLISQVPGEANPINMVTKLSQLTSLLSSIEDKVLGGVLQLLLASLWSPLCSENADCAPFDCPKDAAFSSPPSLNGFVHLYPQVKALLHEGPESPHRRSLIPPVTFEVSGCALVLCSWRLRDILFPVEGGLWAHLYKVKEPSN